jgi:pantoate--beta-alanine ligase
MEVVATTEEMRETRQNLTGSLGFVPTMGYLHDGHLELVRRARAENQHVVVSIFVNPAQFGPGEDFKAYPRDPERDLALLNEEYTDIVFMPHATEIYPAGFDTRIEVGKITERLEGAARPGHFRGVATVVAKLFNIVQPTRAYFGQKDAQQLAVIRKMVADLGMDLEIVAVPTVREEDGLAMSSRNVYLDEQERESALVLIKSLRLANKLFKGGERDASVIRREMTSLIQGEPRAKIEYISVADAGTLEELEVIDRPAVVSLAVKIGRTRLIDNTTLTP